jgi:hypothetical protein
VGAAEDDLSLQMAFDIHALMQDTHDLDPVALPEPKEQHVRADGVPEIAGTDGAGAATFHIACGKRLAGGCDQPDVAVSLRDAPLIGAVVPNLAQVPTRAGDRT